MYIIHTIYQVSENHLELGYLIVVTKELFLFELMLACLVCARTNEGYTILWHRKDPLPPHWRQSTSNVFPGKKAFIQSFP